MDAAKLKQLRRWIADLKKTSPVAEKYKSLRKGGFAKGKIHLAKDWDSDEVNEEIAREFGMTE